MAHDIDKTLLTRKQIDERVKVVAAQIHARIRKLTPPGSPGGLKQDPRVTIVPIMTGSMIFAADLIRDLPVRMRVQIVAISSYPGTATKSKGALMKTELAAMADDLAGSHVLIVDDILDSGQTLDLAIRSIKEYKPASVETCVFLRKDRPEAQAFPVDYVCFDIPDEFVVGYGLDYDGYYRNLPDVVTLKEV
jgi:hypoxanthine phosphoribosyltransferase